MQKQLTIWKFISDSLKDNIAIMLLYVLESAGSSPGRRGFFMAVNIHGQMIGSIGGGIMEHKFVERAKANLAQQTIECSIHHQVHNKSAAKNQSGMICSGEQTILLYTVTNNDLQSIDQMIDSLSANQNGWLQVSPKGVMFNNDSKSFNDGLLIISEKDWLYTQKTGYANQLFIVGAGHCALALSKIMRMMDFYIHLIDDRKELNTFDENEYAHKKQIVESYSELDNIVPPGNNTYVVIMTMGYRTDDMAIRALKDKTFKYFGVLGSAKKMEKMFATYRQEAFDEAWLSSLSAPAGLAIKSQTPEEIAISIAGEIIRIKNGS